MKELIVFDLDGTLAQSKSPVDTEMAELLTSLLCIVKVAVISGGAWPQFEKQVLAKLPLDAKLKRLSILPTCGTRFYQFNDQWDSFYADDFDASEKAKINSAFAKAVGLVETHDAKIWGEQVEDRGSQITFSGLGQQAPIDAKRKWDPNFTKRKKIQAILDNLIPEFSVNLGGTTSIDVTKPGIDKAFGIGKLRDTLSVAISDMLFIGDAIFPGGNDYPVQQAGVRSICVRDPEETKRVVQAIIACLSDATSASTKWEEPCSTLN
ncbi:HAD-IIB family hydrolase [Rhodopirellula baltica]|uniref:phosphomannomutase n=1 Tax=Rhodopirellula baltica WH47 TaxID=991778 RepID=F2B115_RHOBT|nr:HAD-IIB family hydrolase [Rhodopirellula baltica]EGF24367.1 HAD-superfamily hydrolase, subfamily IIB [Rhodopirellula baltica WH47]